MEGGTKVPASLESVRERMKVKPTARDAGLNLTIDVTVYDHGVIQVDGRPIWDNHDLPEAWLAAVEYMMTTLREFQRQVAQRRATRQT
jgi:hypothetical protein